MKVHICMSYRCNSSIYCHFSFEPISLPVECLITHGRDQATSATGKWHANTYLLEKDGHFVVHHPTDSHMIHLSFSIPTLGPSVTWLSLRTHKEAHTNPRKGSHSHTKGFHPSHLSKQRFIVVVYRNWETQKRLYHQESNPYSTSFPAKVIVGIFNFSHSDRYKMVSQSFVCIYSTWKHACSRQVS